MTTIPFRKMNGLGNEIAVVDLRQAKARPQAVVGALSAKAGLAFDQAMVLLPPKAQGTDAFVEIYNSDGSKAGACGNGTRCIADHVMAATGRDSAVFQTAGGLLVCHRNEDGSISVDMGAPRFEWHEIPLSERFADTRFIEFEVGPRGAPVMHSPAVVNVGNPHVVFFVNELEAIDLGRIGPMIEYHPMFPERVNVGVAEVVSPERLRLKVWERGAGLTKACGSAACAAAVSAARRRQTGRSVHVELPGGELHILWREDDDHIVMTGPVAHEYDDEVELDATPAGA
ncbi:diaminopimelate epimerase [Lutibaculum baratangense]|uniref:Diaminopimelate epimerase n=1 Tax=Lutibaculum baratangense AMV1 TaxID=631454 RepID=V4RL92_9HYPH|nr:diaminopimelate epimerase [Lutibaculum baratangense]ESR26074.1 Diaminopimelate epimerase [Lutibaculum baratangense AMV1]